MATSVEVIASVKFLTKATNSTTNTAAQELPKHSERLIA